MIRKGSEYVTRGVEINFFERNFLLLHGSEEDSSFKFQDEEGDEDQVEWNENHT